MRFNANAAVMEQQIRIDLLASYYKYCKANTIESFVHMLSTNAGAIAKPARRRAFAL